MSLLTRFHRYTFARVYKNFVNGEFVEATGQQRFPVRNPVTQELLGEVPQTTQEEFNAIIENSKEAFKTWSKTPLLSNCFFYFSSSKIHVRLGSCFEKRSKSLGRYNDPITRKDHPRLNG